MVLKILGALVLVCGIFTNAARADDVTDALKCLAAGVAMGSSINPAGHSIGQLATMYWLGQIDARLPGTDIPARVRDMAASMSPADYQAETSRCGLALQMRGDVLTRLDQDEQLRQDAN